MSQQTLMREEGTPGTSDPDRVIRIDGQKIVLNHSWPGIGSSRKTLEIPDILNIKDLTLREAIRAGNVPTLDHTARVEILMPYQTITHDSDDVPEGRTPTEKTDNGPLILHQSEAEALIAYFLIPPPVEALTPGALDAIRTRTLDPEGFYELAIPTKPPNEFCRPEAFAWTMGLVLDRFRSHYV